MLLIAYSPETRRPASRFRVITVLREPRGIHEWHGRRGHRWRNATLIYILNDALVP